jgi:galactose mutarotase-like enzyme
MKSPVLFQNQPVVELADQDSRVLISAGHGARILRWERGGREIIHWPDDADWTKILKVRGGDPVLFPFIARHFVDGVIDRWRDTDGTVRTMAQHGFARDAKFAVLQQRSTFVRLRLTDDPSTREAYPFAFVFDVVMELHPNARLEIRFETINKSGRPLPYYPGHHFYFAIPHAERAAWNLSLPCESWGRQSPDGAIVHEPAASTPMNLADPGIVDRFAIKPACDHVALFNGDRRLVIEIPGRGSAPWYAVTTWTEKPDSDFYCIEPWLGLPNAIHHGEGLRHVLPDHVETAICVLDASAW